MRRLALNQATAASLLLAVAAAAASVVGRWAVGSFGRFCREVRAVEPMTLLKALRLAEKPPAAEVLASYPDEGGRDEGGRDEGGRDEGDGVVNDVEAELGAAVRQAIVWSEFLPQVSGRRHRRRPTSFPASSSD